MAERAAIYCRISQDRTGRGLGVARQEEDCRAWAERHGWTVADVYADDDISAYSGKRRPGYQRLLDDVDAGRRDGLIVWHPDRLHRSPAELEDFISLVERTGLAIGTVTAGDVDLTSATGRMTARIVGAVARHESDHKAERIRRKHVELAQNGRVAGGGIRPFGYERDRVTIRESEAELIREAADRVLAGEGLRTVCSDWNDRGVRTVTGVAWTTTTLKRLLRSARIAGIREHQGVVAAKAVWPAIIDVDTSRRLRRLLDDPARRTSPDTNVRSYLLPGFVFCGYCAMKGKSVAMVARPVIRKGHRYRRYFCSKDKGGCNGVGIGAEPLENLIVEAMMLRLDTTTLAEAVADRRSDLPLGQADEIETRLTDLADMFASGEITRAEWAAARAKLTGRLEEARQVEAAQVRDTAITAQLAQPGVLRAEWPQMALPRRRLILGAIIDKVMIAPTTRANNQFDPQRVNVVWKA